MQIQPSKLACCLAAFACASAAAQSGVEAYGLLDLNVGVTSNATRDGGNLARVGSNGMNTSRLGFRGSEDLGGASRRSTSSKWG